MLKSKKTFQPLKNKKPKQNNKQKIPEIRTVGCKLKTIYLFCDITVQQLVSCFPTISRFHLSLAPGGRKAGKDRAYKTHLTPQRSPSVSTKILQNYFPAVQELFFSEGSQRQNRKQSKYRLNIDTKYFSQPLNIAA